MTRTTHYRFKINDTDISNAINAARRERSLAFHAMFSGLFDRRARHSNLTKG